ncbi:MAG: glutamine synthetase type III, partial [Clostridia bacterium]|nr:glutamine synthetase type III [Clostridia bacterium]
SKRAVSHSIDCTYELATAKTASSLIGCTAKELSKLEGAVNDAKKITGSFETASHYKNSVLASMDTLRDYIDRLEAITDAEFWPYPSYGDMLFSVK